MLIALTSVDARAAVNTPAFATGSGSFTFEDQQGDPTKPVKVWYFKPAKYTSSTPLLFVMHGTQRDAERYRDQWIKYAETYGAFLLVPEFSTRYYPGTDYPQGNLFDANSQPMPDQKTGFSLIEHLFDHVASRTGNRTTSYYIYGHSAGGQFVHRMLMLSPAARIRRAVAANPGFYTLPRDDEEFPFGMKKSGLLPAALTDAFGRELIILLGEQDTLEHQENLNRSPGAMAQGRHRLARGINFFRIAQEEAGKRGVAFAWKLQTVPDSGHSNSKMAAAAAQALFGVAAK